VHTKMQWRCITSDRLSECWHRRLGDELSRSALRLEARCWRFRRCWRCHANRSAQRVSRSSAFHVFPATDRPFTGHHLRPLLAPPPVVNFNKADSCRRPNARHVVNIRGRRWTKLTTSLATVDVAKEEQELSWDGRPFGHNRQGPKRCGLCPF